jgi:hypothetical protein
MLDVKMLLCALRTRSALHVLLSRCSNISSGLREMQKQNTRLMQLDRFVNIGYSYTCLLFPFCASITSSALLSLRSTWVVLLTLEAMVNALRLCVFGSLMFCFSHNWQF